MSIGASVLGLLSACADADQGADAVADEASPVQAQVEGGACKWGSTGPCSSYVTSAGATIELGKYGAVMDKNVGTGFANTVSPLDTEASCRSFSALFGGSSGDSEQLNTLGDLKLNLYTVYRPANWVEGEKYPVVTWGNGTCAQPEGYGALLRYVASQGFVVVAANSRYVGTGEAQRKGIDFLTRANGDASSPYYGRLDLTRVGAMGHSQGSAGTIAASSDARIKTVVLFNGGTSARKPFLAISGDRDIGNPTATTYRNAVNNAPKAAFLFYHKVPQRGSGDGHLTLMTQPERVAPATAEWLKLVLNDDASAKAWFVGASCELCGKSDDFEYGQRGL
ncbi:MAG: hypothetical protein ABW252_04670 [Polyangiales bacterium]